MGKGFNFADWKRSQVFRGGFSSYLDGKYHDYQGLDNCLTEIKNLVEDVFVFAERQAEENEALKDLHWENEELKKMKADRDLMEADYHRGFPITEQEQKAIRKWEDQHWTNQHNAPDNESRLAKMGAIGGSFYYKFVPTSIGTSGAICCSACMEKARRDSGNNRDRFRELIKEYDAEYEFQDF